MQPINPRIEKKVLKELRRLLVEEERERDLVFTYKLRSGFLFFVPWVAVFFVALFSRALGLSHADMLWIGALLGFFLGLSILYRTSMQQIPIFKQHLNLESVQTRLDELGE